MKLLRSFIGLVAPILMAKLVDALLAGRLEHKGAGEGKSIFKGKKSPIKADIEAIPCPRCGIYTTTGRCDKPECR